MAHKENYKPGRLARNPDQNGEYRGGIEQKKQAPGPGVFSCKVHIPAKLLLVSWPGAPPGEE
jgi:hypothetical protein